MVNRDLIVSSIIKIEIIPLIRQMLIQCDLLLSSDPTIKLSDSTLKTYTGNYKREDVVPIAVTLKDKELVLRMTGIPLLNLIPQTKDRFSLMDLDPKVFFTKNNDGTVDTVSIQDGDNTIRCLKVSS